MKSGHWCALALLLLAGCNPTQSRPAAAEPQTASPTPASAASSANSAESKAVELQILDFQGIEDLVASHRGKVVVMDAWSTSCPPCVREFPNLVALHKKHGADRLACISLSFDYDGIGKPEEVKDAVLGFLREQGATFDNVLSSLESDELCKKFKLAAVPAVFVYDAGGKLRKRFDNEQGGEFTYRDVDELVAQMIEGKTPIENADAQ